MKLCGFYALDSGRQTVCRGVIEIMTLLSSDTFATGAPARISSLAAANAVDVSIREIGRLQNPVLEGDPR